MVISHLVFGLWRSTYFWNWHRVGPTKIGHYFRKWSKHPYKDKFFLWHTDNKSTSQAQSNVLIWNTWIVRIVLPTLKFWKMLSIRVRIWKNYPWFHLIKKRLRKVIGCGISNQTWSEILGKVSCFFQPEFC